MDKLVEEIKRIPTASVSDALDNLGIEGFMSHAIKSRTTDARIVGFATTVRDELTREKISPMKALEAIENAQKGDMLVRAIEGAGDETASDIALFGGIMALGSSMKGLAGAVIDGGARDMLECKELNFPVFSRSVVPTTSVGRTKVTDVNVPVKCGGVRVNPRDLIVCDMDGVLVVPKEKLEVVIEEAKKIDDLEGRVSEELRRGVALTTSVKKYSRI
jgi:regulator of RNase E activity RraA